MTKWSFLVMIWTCAVVVMGVTLILRTVDSPRLTQSLLCGLIAGLIGYHWPRRTA